MVRNFQSDSQEMSFHPSCETYEFELADFQKQAITGIEQDKNVLITAHTGSGKTLPAEHAIKKYCGDSSLFDGTVKRKKVIYTAPIKALSNQKFKDFTEKFPEISFGILTGDIKFNPEADCIIMTTEILRNTLFQRKSINAETLEKDKTTLHFEMDVDNELACVVFDEVHYINDADRGKVWEETIMMLPESVQLVMLSATIDKALQFADWIEKTRNRETWLCPTSERIVPLTHYGYLCCQDSAPKGIKDKKTRLMVESSVGKLIPFKQHESPCIESNFHKIAKISTIFENEKIRVHNSFVLNNIVGYLHRNNMLPAICFVLSRKQVERYAKEITLCLFDKDSKEQSIVKKECDAILRKLPNYKEYLNLKEYHYLIKLLEKGIAVHHSGIVPVFREMIEMLFAKGYVKLLFATETFAVGVNMPTKTVLFTGVKKFSGNGFRNLYSHEYTQMAGRAGRRGCDKVGHVIHLNNLFEQPLFNEYNMILNGKPQTLVSKFNVYYNLILNLIANKEQHHNFTQTSMIQNEITKELTAIENQISEIEKKIIANKEQIRVSKTPQEIIDNYLRSCEMIPMMKGKKRKQKERERISMEEEYLSLITDSKRVTVINNLEKELEKRKNAYVNTKQYMDGMSGVICEILEKNGFISLAKNDISDGECGMFELTEMGLTASLIQEVFGLPWSEMYNETKGFEKFTTKDLILLFSCFTNVSVSDEYKRYRSDYWFINKLYDNYEKYYDIETNYKINTGADYSFHFDLLEEMSNWYECNDEVECKKIIGGLFQKGIFLGEFVKAILKINNISNEFEKICETHNNLELLQKLKEIPKATLKFIASNQSLYV